MLSSNSLTTFLFRVVDIFQSVWLVGWWAVSYGHVEEFLLRCNLVCFFDSVLWRELVVSLLDSIDLINIELSSLFLK